MLELRGCLIYLYFSFNLLSVLVAYQTIKSITPTPVKATSCHQPDLPISCNRLAETAVIGKNNIKSVIPENKPKPVSEFIKFKSIKYVTTDKIVKNK